MSAYFNKKSLVYFTKFQGFTIVELLIVIVVLGILAAITLTAFNPGEITKRTRDATRATDLRAIDRVLLSYITDSSAQLGTTNTVYLSLPDANPNCNSYALPTLPSGWNYTCKPVASYRNTDGTGWIPVNLSSISAGAKLNSLPVDPINSINGRLYYSYIPGVNSWELNSPMEAQSSATGDSGDKVSTDGGDDPTKLEIGNNLILAPWSFEFVTFPTVANNSGFPGWFKFSGTGTMSLGSDGTSPNYAEMTGYVWYVWMENIPFSPDATYKMTCKIRQVTDPTVGGKGNFCGWAGITSDGVTATNLTGLNSYSSQHYHAMSNPSYAIGSWNSATGYTKGWGSPDGTSGGCSNPATPCKMQQNTRYIRPLFIMNYTGGNGISDIDSIVITKK